MNSAGHILLVDDDTTNLLFAQKILNDQGYRVAATRSGAQALSFLRKKIPDLILLDINMPGMDGFETFGHIREIDASVPVVFLTSQCDAETEVRCFKSGALDFVNKPFVAPVLLSRVRRILDLQNYQRDLEHMVAEEVAKVTKLQDNLIAGIATLVESRDTDTGTHINHTRGYVKLLVDELLRRGLYAGVLDKAYGEDIIRASVLHDVGKIKIRDAILCKPGRFTPGEFEEMKKHAVYGGEIIRRILSDSTDHLYLDIAVKIARHHHERWDGRGYPDGLAGEAIPLEARIMSLADVYDALISERVYKEAFSKEKALAILREGRGTQFDPDLTQVFLDCLAAL